MKFNSDIDIDLADRDLAISALDVIPAAIERNNKITKHNTGVYVTDIPVDPFTGISSLDYQQAENRGYVKIDLLNVHLYKQVKSEQHLLDLMHEPDWSKLYDPEICAKLIHINGHYDTLIKMPEAVNTIPRLAMFLSVIRPAKRQLIGLPWAEVAKTVWERPVGNEYYFKKSHAISYATLVVVNLNLLCV